MQKDERLNGSPPLALKDKEPDEVDETEMKSTALKKGSDHESAISLDGLGYPEMLGSPDKLPRERKGHHLGKGRS